VQAEAILRWAMDARGDDVYWETVGRLGLEHLHLSVDLHGVIADGMVVGEFESVPLRVHYRIVCDPGWRARELHVADLASGASLELRTSEGSWEDADRRRSELADAVDVDLAITPFTNTLPIRRLRLEVGQSAEIAVVFVAVAPTLAFRRVRQRYTRLTSDRYLYESLESDFTCELIVDPEGLVVDYPGDWRRVFA
jgi:hypothetical protein